MSNSGGRKWNARYFSITDQYLKDNGLRRKSVPRDGCCLFRAVAEQVYLTQTTHWELRRLCANYIRSNPSRFKSFLTVSLKDYCWKLSNCTLWGGEMELVALSELLEQTITVYQEQDEKIVTQDFCPKKTTHKPKILLLFSGNNHYDTLWSSEEESIASFCQSILYELLIESVMKSRMNHRDLSLAVKLRGGDFNYRYVHCHSLLDRYSHDLLRGLAALSYFNIPYIVYKREKEARERADRRLAVKMQFTIGDKCQITRDGKQYTGDIVSGLTNSIVNVFVPELRKKVKVSVGEIMLIPQQKSSNAKSKNRLSNSQKSNNTSKEEVVSNARKSYSKSGRVQQDRNQRPPLLEMKEVTKPIYMKQDNPDVMIGRSVLQDVPTCDNVEQLSTDNNLYEQNTVGFSDTTVRMNSLMGRGNPLELFNQESLASINEAPESEWPILHASGGSGRGRIGNIILSGSNPQRCHLDGPPAPEHSIHQSLLSHNLVAFLAQEMNPPVHLLNTGTPEGRQQFMYEFARKSLQFYSKYVPNSELESSLTELLRIDFEDFMRTPYNNGDYSVITSSSRDGSQSDIHEHSQSNTPRVSDEDHTSSDTHTDSPAHETAMVLSPSSSTNIITPISPPMEATHVETISLPNDVESDKEGVSHEEIPTDSTQHEDSMNIANQFQQPPMMFAPGGPPNPYGFPGYSFPLMFPGPMLPWPYYHPMNGGAAFMIPPQMLPPQMRPQLMEPTHISDEQIKETMGESHEGGSDENVSIEEVHEEDTPVNKQDTPIIKEDSNVPLVASKPSQEENTRVIEQQQHTVKQVTTTANNIATAPNGVEARNRSEGITNKPKPFKGGGATNKSSVTNSRSRQYNNYTSRRNTKHQYYDYYPNQRKRDVNN